MTPRVDPLITELVSGSKTQDVGVKNAMLKALYEVVTKAGGNMTEASRNSILGVIDGEVDENDGKCLEMYPQRVTDISQRCDGNNKCKAVWCAHQSVSS